MATLFYSKGNQQFGPVSVSQLKQLATDGRILPTDLVWREGTTNKVNAAQVRGLLFKASASVPVPPPIPTEATEAVSSQWHYTEKGQQRGPISAAELKSRAVRGAFAPDDLVWKEGMTAWVPARKVKGLLATPQAAVTSPPPLPPAETELKTAGVLDAIETTGRLAAKQAERTRLVTIPLTGAYHRLGKALYEANAGRAKFEQQFSALDALKNQMTAPAPPAEPPSQPQDLAQQAKAMAKTAADATQRKVAKTHFDHSLSSLGKSAYEKRNELAVPQQDVAAIESLLQQVTTIDAEIQQLSEQKPARSLIDNRIVHAVLTVGCFPIGLFLIWKSDQWSKRAKWIWTGAVAALVIVGALSPNSERNDSAKSVEQTPTSSVSTEKSGRTSSSPQDARRNDTDAYQGGFDDGFMHGARDGKSDQRMFDDIQGGKGTAAVKKMLIAELQVSAVKKYQDFLKSGRELEAVYGAKHDSVLRFAGMAEGYRKGFNGECRAYQIRKR